MGCVPQVHRNSKGRNTLDNRFTELPVGRILDGPHRFPYYADVEQTELKGHFVCTLTTLPAHIQQRQLP